jgi:hypothetical protein
MITLNFANPWYWPLWAFAFMNATLLMFLAIMSLKSARDAGKLDHISRPIYLLFEVYAVVGVVLDVILQITIGTLIFVELPREPLFTGRCERHEADDGDGWRKSLAFWLCHNLLDPFQQGGHCHAAKDA